MHQRHSGLSWSHSRDRILVACPRRYYWHYYGRHDPDPEVARSAWVLRQLTTLDLTLGTVLHTLARETALAVREGRSPPSHATMLERARAEMNRVFLSSQHRDWFLRCPTETPMLQEIWYGGRVDPATVERIRQKLFTCVANLAASPIWDILRSLPADAVLIADSLTSVTIDHTTVFAAPDLVYRPGTDRGSCDSGEIVLVDWKTGRQHQDADSQLAVYALSLTTGSDLDIADGRWVGRVNLLATGGDAWYELSALDLERARRRIRTSVAVMRTYLADPERNIPLPRDAFPLATPECRSRCPTCPFLELCELELARADKEEHALMPSTS